MSTAGVVNMVPPGWSRLPVIAMRHWIAHWHSTPNSWVETPIRPWTAAPPRAMSRASSRIDCAATPLTCWAISGVKSATSTRSASMPST